jgi:hypothetical protein
MLFLHRNEDHEPWWPGLQPTKSLVIDALPQCERMSRCFSNYGRDGAGLIPPKWPLQIFRQGGEGESADHD